MYQLTAVFRVEGRGHEYFFVEKRVKITTAGLPFVITKKIEEWTSATVDATLEPPGINVALPPEVTDVSEWIKKVVFVPLPDEISYEAAATATAKISDVICTAEPAN